MATRNSWMSVLTCLMMSAILLVSARSVGALEVEISGPSGGTLAPDTEYGFGLWIRNPGAWWNDPNPRLVLAVLGGTVTSCQAGTFDSIDVPSLTWESSWLPKRKGLIGYVQIRTHSAGHLVVDLSGSISGASGSDHKIYTIAELSGECWSALRDLANCRASTNADFASLFTSLCNVDTPSVSGYEMFSNIPESQKNGIRAVHLLGILLEGLINPAGGLSSIFLDIEQDWAGLPDFLGVFYLWDHFTGAIDRYTWYVVKGDYPLGPVMFQPKGYLNFISEEENAEAIAWEDCNALAALGHLQTEEDYINDALSQVNVCITFATNNDDYQGIDFFKGLKKHLEGELDVISKLKETAQALKPPVPSVSRVPTSPAISIPKGATKKVTFNISNAGGVSSVGDFTLSVSHGLEIIDWNSPNPNMNCTLYREGDLIWHSDGRQYPAEYDLLDCFKKYDKGESNTIEITFKAVENANQWIKYRLAFLPVTKPSRPSTNYVRNPSNSGPNIVIDQQGWFAYDLPVEVTVENTVQASPAGKGLEIKVDDTEYTESHTFTWVEGSQHTVEAPSPQIGNDGYTYTYDYWSDGGSRVHTITPQSDGTYTAYYTGTPPQVTVTVEASPAGKGLNVKVDDTEYTESHTFVWDKGSSHTIEAPSPQTGSDGYTYTYDYWSDGGSRIHTITPQSGGTYTAYYALASSITVTSPNGGEVWYEGETHDINWSSLGITGNVEIHLSTDSGSSYPSYIASVPVSNGSYPWTIPKVNSTQCRIRLQEEGGEVGDESNADFEIIVVPIIYVDDDANGLNDGSSWDDAYNFLQDALADADLSPKPVEIHVTQGIYTPDSNSAVPDGTGDREATFQLINGVALKGGYAGFGAPDPNARNTQMYETILNGDLDGNDVYVSEPCDLLTEPTRAENSSHIVTGSGTDETAIIDGLTVFGGNTNGSGAGMSNIECSPIVINCRFSGNSANFGGGMRIYGGNPKLVNCTFSNNSAANSGGALYNNHSDPSITNCSFIGNWADQGGGGIYGSTSNTTLTKCIFIRNTAENGEGGGMKGRGTLTNCIFYENSAAPRAGGLYAEGESTLTNCTFTSNFANLEGGGIFHPPGNALRLKNCILWGDNPNEIDGDSVVVDYSDIQGGWPDGEGNIDKDPLFVRGPLGLCYLSQTDAGQAIQSPCVDVGSDSAANLDLDSYTTRTDIITDDGIVDMGYHYPPEYRVGDIDLDWDVDFGDYAVLGNRWEDEPCNDHNNWCGGADVNKNGKVDFSDVKVIFDHWLEGSW